MVILGDMMKILEQECDRLLEAKELSRYYREQDYQSTEQFKLELDLLVDPCSKERALVSFVLQKIQRLIKDVGYVTKTNPMDPLSGYQYHLKMDPQFLNEQIEFFTRLKEIERFSEGMIKITSINLLFIKEPAYDRAKVHRNLLLHLRNFQQYFTKPLDLIEDYRIYMKRALDQALGAFNLNYLKRREIEIRNLKGSLTPFELKNFILGCSYEIYTTSLSWFERRRYQDHYKRSSPRLDELPVEKNCQRS